jgi:RNA polymerase sigma-70 factor (ECF subfamily)
LTKNPTMQSIKRWLSQGKAKSFSDADVFTRLYENTHLIVFRYVYGLSGGSAQDAEDLTAETYMRAWKRRKYFNGNEQAAIGWLLRISKNLVIDLSRRRKVRNIGEEINIELLVDPNQTPEMDIVTREHIAILWHLLGTLPEDIREILVLRYMLGWQIKQIAEHLGKSENNTSVTIRRALQKLQSNRSLLQEKDNE